MTDKDGDENKKTLINYYENYTYQFHYEGILISEPTQVDRGTYGTERVRKPAI
jgi:hypothetical protein